MKRQTPIAALALTAALLLSACGGGPGSDPAVTVDGTAYSVESIQDAAAKISAGTGQDVTPGQLIGMLPYLPVLRSALDGSAAEPATGDLERFLTQIGVDGSSPALLDIAEVQHYFGSLQMPADEQVAAVATQTEQLQEQVRQVDVDVNPRYGTWDAASAGVLPSAPAWIKTDAPGS